MTVREIECKLYIETLREKFQNRDFMFTSICEKELILKTEAFKRNLENKGIDAESGNLITRIIQKCKDKDFYLALMSSYWMSKFSSNGSLDADIVRQCMLRKMDIDPDKICVSVLLDSYSPFLIHSQKINFIFDEVKELICGYDEWDGTYSLEIDTDFFGESTKVMSDEQNFIISSIIRDMKESHSKVLHPEEDFKREDNGRYNTIILQVSSCKDQTAEGIASNIKELASLTDRVILFDTKETLSSKEMFAFRKEIIDSNLLEVFVSGESIFTDTYILRTSGQGDDAEIHLVCDGINYMGDNILNNHFTRSKSDLISVGYDFKAASKLISRQAGRGYAFNKLFYTPNSGVEEQNVTGRYPVFQMKDFPNDFSNVILHSSDLDLCEISGIFSVVTENKAVLYIGDDKIRVCYIEASIDHPIYVGRQFLVLDLNTDVLDPRYVHLLCSKGIMERVFDKDSFERKWFRYSEFDNTVKITPEMKIGYLSSWIQIPSKKSQLKEFTDAQFINASSADRQRALETMLAEKTWLNEEHIRNIKHRIGNELVPIKNDIEAFSRLFQNHPDGLTLETVRGKGEKVSKILERLNRDVSKVTESLQDLTRTIDKGDLKPVDIVSVVREFSIDLGKKQGYELIIEAADEHIYINGSINMINSILRNIVDNAIRHGFVDKKREDYAIKVVVSKDGSGNCVLDVKNNGEAMSPIALENFFKRGSVAGTTGHSGIGGADVKDTANAMGGEATLPICEDGWSVCVRISLPILNSERL